MPGRVARTGRGKVTVPEHAGQPRAGRLERLRRFVACRRCALGWALYLAAAAALVALYAR